jgi:hypothetical protein
MIDCVNQTFEPHFKGSNANNVEDFFKSQNVYSIVKDFVEGKGSNKIIIYYAPENSGVQDYDMRENTEAHLFITNGETEKLTGKGIYFLRLVDRAVNLSDIDGEIVTGEITQDTLKQLNLMISGVF